MKSEASEDPDLPTVEPERQLAELLSPRELEVLASVADGGTNREIALELFISVSTVQSHVKRIMAKLGAKSRTAAAVRYVRSYDRRDPDGDVLQERPLPSSDTADQLARAYRDTMRAGDPSAARAVVDLGLNDGLPAVAVQSRVIAPAMGKIGEQWEQGRVSVAEEHLASVVSHQVLTRLYPDLFRRPRRDGDTVVVAAVHGEHHELGLRMVADVFDGDGFDVRFFGADVPQSSLLAWVEERRPTTVALGVTMPLGAATLVRQILGLRECNPELQVIIGGQGVPDVLRCGAGVLYFTDTEQLNEHLTGALRSAVAGETPAGIARGGAGFRRLSEVATTGADMPLERMAQSTPDARDAVRGQASPTSALDQPAVRDLLTEQ
jgi:MerR family transcriptional regulator, light-induced transcriptional regulator